MKRVILSAFVLACLTAAAHGQLTFEQTHTIRPSDAGEFSQFGFSVAMDGDWVVYGAWSSKIYIFHDDGSKLTETQILRGGRSFGLTVDIDGDWLAAGDLSTDESGRVEMFEYNGSEWQLVQTISPPDGAQWDHFGVDVALDGDTLLVGASGADGVYRDSGVAYIFEHDGSSWVEAQKLDPLREKAHFGSRVALDGSVAAVAASFDGGRVLVYEFDGDTWVEVAQLQASSSDASPLFGADVALDGHRILVGAPGDGTHGGGYVFERRSGWEETDRLIPDVDYGYFGESVALDEDGALLGERFREEVAVYRDVAGSWLPERCLVPTDFSMYFGYAVDIHEGKIAVGAFCDGGYNYEYGAGMIYRPLALLTNTDEFGGRLEARVESGVPGARVVLLAREERTGRWWQLAVDEFDDDGIWDYAQNYPTGLLELDITLMAHGWAIGEGPTCSNQCVVHLR